MSISVIAAAMLALAFALPSIGQTSGSMEALRQMAGCWDRRGPAAGDVISEQWMMPEGGGMLGIGRTVRSNEMTDWELLRVESRAQRIFFFSRPKEN